MSCPTCDHTMHGLGERWFWCPRCGTTLNDDDRVHTTQMPNATNQCRAYLKSQFVSDTHFRSVLRNLVLLPEER